MKFDPNAAAEKSNDIQPFPDGFYDIEVAEAEEQTSKAGNEMLKLKMWAYDQAGNKRVVFDYLLSNQPWKIKQFAECVGRLDAFEAGELSAEMIPGSTGRAKLKTETFNERASNKIDKYIRGEAPVASRRTLEMASQVRGGGASLDDEVPFAPCWQ